MLLLEALCAGIRDGLVNPTELTIVDRSGHDVSLILSHNVQYMCNINSYCTALIVTIRGVDHHIETATQVSAATTAILNDYQTQLDELGIDKPKPVPRRPTLSLDLTGLTPNQVARIIEITEE